MNIKLQLVLERAWKRYEKAKSPAARAKTHKNKHRETTEVCLCHSLSILHGPYRNEEWARRLREIIHMS